MLSLFPDLLTYQLLSPFLIRLALGAVFAYWAYRTLRGTHHTTNNKIVGLTEAAIGILLIIGLWTQLAALAAVIDLVVRIIDRIKKHAFLTDGVNYYLLLTFMALSLLFSGAGALAFDLPL